MKKNGFTIIEITVTVLLLAVLAIFIVPKISTIIFNNKNKVCDSIIISIETAAENYTYLNTSVVDSGIDNNTYYDITLLDLQREGLLDVKLENPHTGENISNANTVRITKNGNIYIYTYMGDECN